MKNKYIEITREELYRRVWKETLRGIAQDLGISDAGLRKICRRNEVPTPHQGYHLTGDERRKKRLRIPLSPPEKSPNNVIGIERRYEPVDSSTKLNIESVWQKLISSPLPITGQQSREIDQALKAVRKPLHKKKPDNQGILRVP